MRRLLPALLLAALVTPAAAGEAAPEIVGRPLLEASPVERAAIARAVNKDGLYLGTPFGVGDCEGCHPDVFAQWRGSAHRFSSFNNPYYRVSVEDFRKERGMKGSRFCAACHEPALLGKPGRAPGSSAVDEPVDVASGEAQAGLFCLVCHSMDRVKTRGGNADYHIDVRDVPLERPAHNARLYPPLLASADFCQTCHKVGLEPEVTHDRWLRGQDDYDPWQTSGASGNGAGSIWRPPAAKRCQDCHMPLEKAVLGDRGAKDGMVRSHRFLGPNAALPWLRGDEQHLAETRRFLEGAVSLDAGWVGASADGAGLIDVILRARRVGHRFPGGTMDSNEVWLEASAFDAAGRLIGRSGGLDARGRLASDAHLVRAQPVDGEGLPIRNRDPQHTRGTAWNQSLSPSDPSCVRFQAPPGTARVEVRLLYRKFTADYARRACRTVRDRKLRARCEAVPIVEVARTTLAAGETFPDDWRRLTDRGMALADSLADNASEALPYLLRARDLAPDEIEPILALVRLHLRLGQTDEAAELARVAQTRRPNHPAAWFLPATALVRAYRYEAARPLAERAIQLLPEDRSALALVARVRGVLGDPQGALAAADRLITIDPFLDEAWYERGLALRELGREAEAAKAEERYLYHRVATEVDLALRAKWRTRHPQAADESVPVHVHSFRAP